MANLWRNKYRAECMACQFACIPMEGIFLNRCKHLFCKECFSENITTTLKDKVYCPFKNHGFVCSNEITDNLSRLLSIDALAKFKAKRPGKKPEKHRNKPEIKPEKKPNEHFYQCKSPNCKGWCYYTDDITVFNCPVCKEANCLICQVVHGASTCEEYWEAMVNAPPAPNVPAVPEVVEEIEEKEFEPFANDENLVINKEIVICLICTNTCEPKTAIIIRQCRHTFCNNCLKQYVKKSETFDIKCPYVFKNYSCAAFLNHQEILLLTDKNSYTKLLTNTIPKDIGEKIYICATLNCAGWSIYNNDVDEFECPLCEKKNCLRCKVIHEGKTCHEYLLELIKEKYPNIKENSYEIAGVIQDLETNAEEFTCEICYLDIEPGAGAVFKCAHQFCKECLKMHIEACDEPEVKCPQPKCETVFRDCEIRELINEEQYIKYVKKSMQSVLLTSKDIFTCQTIGCDGHAVYDLNEGDKEFICYLCKCINCLSCKAIHTGKTCAAFKEDFGKPLEVVMLNELLRAGTAMLCSNCKNTVEKVEGCDWIKCVCKIELCWATKGLRWGPMGPKDTSGGCKCRLNGGPPCAPTCRGCH